MCMTASQPSWCLAQLHAFNTLELVTLSPYFAYCAPFVFLSCLVFCFFKKHKMLWKINVLLMCLKEQMDFWIRKSFPWMREKNGSKFSFFLNRKLFLILINLSVLEFPGWKEFHRMDGRRVLGLKTHVTCCVLLLLFCILCPHMG